ncbi:hypothetical protein T492DRAFT_1033364 [Pavlovales sp. CCMP2436]|nr:hypothetical protein T492DRAFT_1033364 [Pavlovales sp. CCMP2436]
MSSLPNPTPPLLPPPPPPPPPPSRQKRLSATFQVFSGFRLGQGGASDQPRIAINGDQASEPSSPSSPSSRWHLPRSTSLRTVPGGGLGELSAVSPNGARPPRASMLSIMDRMKRFSGTGMGTSSASLFDGVLSTPADALLRQPELQLHVEGLTKTKDSALALLKHLRENLPHGSADAMLAPAGKSEGSFVKTHMENSSPLGNLPNEAPRRTQRKSRMR